MLFGTKTLSLLYTSMLLSVSVVEGQHGNLRRLSASFPIGPVLLGTAGDFAILSKTGVSTTGTTSVTGDIGTSPAAATYNTGFSLILDSTTTFAKSPGIVTGDIYAASYTAPTPSKMTTAISDLETAYTDAAGRSLPDHIEFNTGAIGGQTLTQGLYKWGTSVGMTASSELTFDGTELDGNGNRVTENGENVVDPNAVWILQIAGDVNIGNGAFMTLTNGAKAENIFWQVAGATTFGTTSRIEGVFLCKTAMVCQTGSSLNGAALSQTAVTLDTTTIVKNSL